MFNRQGSESKIIIGLLIPVGSWIGGGFGFLQHYSCRVVAYFRFFGSSENTSDKSGNNKSTTLVK